MGIVTSDPFVLATAVASPAGTVAFAYPAGHVQADFTGDNASGSAYLLLNDNDRYEEIDDEFDISYGASTVTLTNKTGAAWPAGTKVQVGLAFADPAGEFRQAGAVADLALTPLATEDTYTDADVNAQFEAVETKLNAALQALRSAGIIAT